MIEIDKLSAYLSTSENKYEETENKLFSIPESEKESRHIYDKYILENKFEFLNKEIHNVPSWVSDIFHQKDIFILIDKVKDNTFFSGVLSCVMPDFRHLEMKSRISFMRDMFKQMCYDLSEKKLYQEYEYNKNHKFSNQDLTKALNNFSNVDEDNFFFVKQYIVDYLSINVYIISESVTFGKNYCIEKYGFRESIDVDKLNPTIFLVKINNRYFPVIREDNNGLFLYDNHQHILENFNEENEQKIKKIKNSGLKKQVKISITKKETEGSEKPNQPEFNKMKLEELQNYAIEKGMDIYKLSSKTNKKIKKTIKELREMLL